MTADLERKLESIKYYATRYEVVMTKGGESLLVGYTSKHSRSGPLAMVRQQAEAFVKYTGAESVDAGKGKLTANGWTITFSGRTQRDAYCNGELPFIVQVAKAA